MKLDQKRLGEVTAVTLSGRLDTATSDEFDRQLSEIATGVGASPVALDLTGVEYISSAGLRIIIKLAKRISADDGRLVLYGLPTAVKEIFDISGFSKILEIHDTQEAALKAVGAP